MVSVVCFVLSSTKRREENYDQSQFRRQEWFRRPEPE